MALYVKFVPWNVNTITGLINKTVKFSTVHEFNDFNEYRYLSPLFKDDEKLSAVLQKILEEEIYKPEFLKNLKRLATDRFSEKYVEKFHSYIDKGWANKLLNPDERSLRPLVENIAFSSVGIFCTSDIKIFEDDSAQLMFAHYAANNSGLALIYEIKENQRVDYCKQVNFSGGSQDRVVNWYKGAYNSTEMRDFLAKTNKWEYENEYRLFNEPGIKKAEDCKITLKAVLYTPRFAGDVEILKAINKSYYSSELVLEQNYAWYENPKFMIKKNKVETITFLKNLCNSERVKKKHKDS